MAEELTPDICVIGGGPGGIAAAEAAAAAGVPVVLVERADLGGGSVASVVPSKALVAAAEVYEAMRIGPALGVSGAPLQVNLNRVRDHIQAVTEDTAGVLTAERLAARGIGVVAGAAHFAGPSTVVAGEQVIRPRRFIIAVGARRVSPVLPGLDTIETMDFAEAFRLDRRPSHLIVLGADRYALELAQAYTRLGVDATVVDQGAPLDDSDPELAAVIVARLRAEGIRIRTGVTIHQIARRRNGVRIMLTDPHDAEANGGEIAVDGSHVLVTGVPHAATDDLGLAAAGIGLDGTFIRVDGNLRTSNRRVYAIGDAVAGGPSVARAELQARAVVRSIIFRVPRGVGDTSAPRVAFTDPGLAAVGLDEAVARRRYGEVQVLRLPFVENVRARIERQPAGLIKVVATRGGRILGAAIAGRGAAELIAPWSLAVANRLSLDAMKAMTVAFPSRGAVTPGVAALEHENAATGLTAYGRRRIIGLLRNLG